MYQKEIIYMSLYKDDIKEGCVGYLKSEERQGKFRLELQIKNIQRTLTGDYPIRIQSTAGWHEAGSLTFKDGNGKWTGSAAEAVIRVEIILSDINIIKGQSKNVSASETWETKPRAMTESEESGQTRQNRKVFEENEPQVMTESNGSGLRARDKVEQDKSVPLVQVQEGPGDNELRTQAKAEPFENELRAQVKAEPVENKLRTQVKTEPVENVLKAQVVTEVRESRVKKQTITENVPLYESKWEQLLVTYEQIHPYGDNRVYVKLEPKDFVILPSGYQHLVNNSFLLHGFYNYRYLILGKEKDFYLGVPGVFYEREKMVALMFGFEAFECEGGNAKEGKFGYYLRRVEL